MRFSAAFTLPIALPAVAQPGVAAPGAPAPTPAPETLTPQTELPDDLDARVRLVGEWQLGEPD